MAEITAQPTPGARPAGGRTKFLIGGIILLAAVIFLIASTLSSNQERYTTVAQLTQDSSFEGKDHLRLIGAVVGTTIEVEPNVYRFEIAHVPDSTAQIQDEGGLAEVLHKAVADPTTPRVLVVVKNEVP